MRASARDKAMRRARARARILCKRYAGECKKLHLLNDDALAALAGCNDEARDQSISSAWRFACRYGAYLFVARTLGLDYVTRSLALRDPKFPHSCAHATDVCVRAR